MLIKKTTILNIPELCRTVLKYLYEEHLMSVNEIESMKRSVIHWMQKTKERKERMIELLPDAVIHETEEEIALEQAGDLLYKKESKDPALMRRIAMVKDGRLNWRKYHNMPGAHTVESRLKAQKMYEEYKKKNPEQEDTGDNDRTSRK